MENMTNKWQSSGKEHFWRKQTPIFSSQPVQQEASNVDGKRKVV